MIFRRALRFYARISMDLLDLLKRFKRGLDGYISYRKAFILIIIVLGCLLYLGPSLLRWLFVTKLPQFDMNARCLNDRINPFLDAAGSLDANIYFKNPEGGTNFDKELLHFVGNGKIGVVVNPDSPMYIKSNRVLNTPVPFKPVITASVDGIEPKEANIIHYTTGLIHKFQCLGKHLLSIDIQYIYYAHRTIPSIFVQDIKITNPADEDIDVILEQTGSFEWSGSAITEEAGDTGGIILVKGQVVDQNNPDLVYVVAVARTKVPQSARVEAKDSNLLHFVTSMHYEGPVHPQEFENIIPHVAAKARSDLQKSLAVNSRKLKNDHIAVWQQLWSSGFYISNSKAQNVINGDVINATIYYVLSHSPAPLSETETPQNKRQELLISLSDPDRCYQAHHTLQASTLWSNLNDREEVNKVVALWFLTLTKQGCQKMVNAGADGVLQAMILSFGALKFANHHLEFGTHPDDLHRDYHFRRISYGNATHLNISVTVGTDNKAMLYVALDRSDKNYFGCDGGCLDPPVLLGTDNKQFPVKLTNPVTSILYITADKQHMEELKHTLHLKNVVEAPAHEHHVLALHRHGHHLGGLPVLFWVSIAFLVVIFHLFLFKLIYNEYCGSSHEKVRARYAL